MKSDTSKQAQRDETERKQGRDRKKTTPAADSQGGLGDQESSCNYFLHYVLEFHGYNLVPEFQFMSFSTSMWFIFS